MTSSTPLSLDRARFNMIEQQVRPWEVLDPAVLGCWTASGATSSCPRPTRPWPMSTWNCPWAAAPTR
jgi:hypothetical protein